MACPKNEKKYIYTATGYLGEKRETMLQNELLLRVRQNPLVYVYPYKTVYY